MTALARAVFAALVVATLAAFFVAQGLKSTPAVIQSVGVEPRVSPNGDGRYDRAIIAFDVKDADRVDLLVVDREGDTVRRLVDGRRVEDGQRVEVRWDGRDDDGRVPPDGTYRPRVVLHSQGRSVIVPRTIRLDTTPPPARVLSIGPDREPSPRPELLPRPDGRPVVIRFATEGLKREVDIWRTSPSVRRVTGVGIDTFEDGVGTARWSGRRRGRRVAPGTFVAVIQARDEAGNIGSSVPLPLKPRPGLKVHGPGGISVRYLAVQPPLLPVPGGKPFTVAVDARGATYNWSLRRVGAPQPVRRSRRATGGPLTRAAPDGLSGLFLFEVRTRTRAARVPVVVDDKRKRRVLVVLPATTWQGRNAVDDDGDGLPNTLDLGGPVRLNRVFAGPDLPPGFEVNEAPLLAHLDRGGHRYDLTTDVALAAGVGPKVEGHGGILIAGDAVWLTEDVRTRLRAFVARGGTLASLGTGSLRAEVQQTSEELRRPSKPGQTDLFGSRIGPVVRRRADLTILEDDDTVQLFAGEEGLFEDVAAWEPTISPGAEARRVAAAVTPDGREVIFAARFGKGLVVRPAIPGFVTRVRSDPASSELLGRIWTLLRTG